MEKLNNITLNHVRIFNVESNNTIDLTNLFTNINIYENLYSNYTTGNIVILDGVSMLEKFPLRGDERLYIEFNGMDKDDMENYGNEFTINKIELIDDTKGKAIKQYTIEFESLIAEKNRHSWYSIGIEDLESSIVEKIVKVGFGLSNIEVEQSKKVKKVIIPGWQGLAAINQISKYAQRVGGLDSASYLFYEDKVGFNFKSIESLITEESPYPVFLEALPSKQGDINFYGFKSFQCDNYIDIDSISAIGGYGSINHEVDLINKTVNTVEYTFDKLYSAWPKIEGSAEQIKKNDINKVKRKTYHSYKTDELEERDISSSTRGFALGLFENFKCIGMTELNTNITVGKTADLLIDTQSVTGDSAEHSALSGKYLITAVRHELTADNGATLIEFRKPTMFEAV